MRKIILAFLIVAVLISCATTDTDITKLNRDGSPVWTTEIPKSKKFIYGVGSAKLADITNSQKLADSLARADIARQLETDIKDATTVYSNDDASSFETVTMQYTDLTVSDSEIIQRWTSKDGRVWSLAAKKRIQY